MGTTYALAQWSTPERLIFIRQQMGTYTSEADVNDFAKYLKRTYRLGSIGECRLLVRKALEATQGVKDILDADREPIAAGDYHYYAPQS